MCISIDEKASRKDNGKRTSARPPEGPCVGPVLALRAQGLGERWAVSGQVENWNGWRSSFAVFPSASEEGTWGPFDTGTGKCDFF